MRIASSPVEQWRDRLTPVVIDGLRTWVLDEGAGDPVVFLHGIPTSSFLWRTVSRYVAAERRCIVPDLLGFGLADRPHGHDLSPYGQAVFLERVLDELGVSRFALVAHDFGALVAAELIQRWPDRVTSLVLTNTSLERNDWGGSNFSPLALLRAPVLGEVAFSMARPFMLRAAFGHYVTKDARLTPDVMAVYWYPFTNGFGDVLLRLSRERKLTEDDFNRWRGALYDFTRPALLVWGGKDPTFRLDRVQDIGTLLRHARVEIFEHANHFLQEDHPEAFARLLLAFFRERLQH